MAEPHFDVLLSRLLKMIDMGAIKEINMTLLIGGTMVAGDVVSSQEYIAAFAELMATHHTQEAIKQGIVSPEDAELHENRLMNEMTTGLDTELPDDLDAIPDRLCIHLKNPQIVVGDEVSSFPSEFPYWRYLLTEIDGWTLGVIRTES